MLGTFFQQNPVAGQSFGLVARFLGFFAEGKLRCGEQETFRIIEIGAGFRAPEILVAVFVVAVVGRGSSFGFFLFGALDNSGQKTAGRGEDATQVAGLEENVYVDDPVGILVKM